MTDNEIIKALECCSEHVRNCAECPLNVTSLDHCSTRLAQNVLNLINRQNQKIKDSEISLEAMRCAANGFKSAYERERGSRITAIQDFAEGLKEEKFTHKNFGELVYVEDIDNLVKEMIGEQE